MLDNNFNSALAIRNAFDAPTFRQEFNDLLEREIDKSQKEQDIKYLHKMTELEKNTEKYVEIYKILEKKQ